MESVEVDKAPEQVDAGPVDVPAVAIDARPNRLSIGPDGILKILGGKRLSIGDIDIDTGSFKADLPGPRSMLRDQEYDRTLSMALKLNETDLICEVIEQIPPHQVCI